MSSQSAQVACACKLHVCQLQALAHPQSLLLARFLHRLWQKSGILLLSRRGLISQRRLQAIAQHKNGLHEALA